LDLSIFTKKSLQFRRSTHVGQLLPDKSFEISSSFLSDVYKSRIEMHYTDDLIANMDETPININMPPNYTICKKGTKNIIILTQGQEKCRVSIMLTILANGEKLSPLVVQSSSLFFDQPPNQNKMGD
jgi:hypothetical protein